MSLWLWMFWIFGNVWSVKISRALRRNIWHFMFVLFFSDLLWFTTVGNSKGTRPHIPFIFSFYISAIPALFMSYIFKATVWAKKKEIQIPYTKPNSLLRTRTAQNINSVCQNFICFIGYSSAPHWPEAAMGFSYLNIKVWDILENLKSTFWMVLALKQENSVQKYWNGQVCVMEHILMAAQSGWETEAVLSFTTSRFRSSVIETLKQGQFSFHLVIRTLFTVNSTSLPTWMKVCLYLIRSRNLWWIQSNDSSKK